MEYCDGSAGTQFAFNTANAVSNGLALRYTVSSGSATPVTASTCAPVATATAVARAQTFTDVPLTHAYYLYIEALYQAGYTSGIAPPCASKPLQFCVNAQLNRDVAAYMLARAKNLTLP